MRIKKELIFLPAFKNDFIWGGFFPGHLKEEPLKTLWAIGRNGVHSIFINADKDPFPIYAGLD